MLVVARHRICVIGNSQPNRCQTKETMRNKRAGILFAFFVVVIVLSLYFQMHLVRDWSGATVYSRENEAYIFTGDSHTGYHFPYVAYPFLILQGFLHVGNEANDQHSAALILHITPSSIDRSTGLYPSRGKSQQSWLHYAVRGRALRHVSGRNAL